MRFPITSCRAPLRVSADLARALIHRAVVETLEGRRLLSSTSGAIDVTFGQHGQGVAPLDNPSFISATLTGRDGKILVAGSAYGAAGLDFAVSRFNADGSADASFGTGGSVTTDINGGDDELYSAALQPDGKLVVGGYADGTAVVVRYNTDGSLDGTFGVGGKQTLDNGTEADGIAVLPGGNLIVSGSTEAGVFATRLKPDGSTDAAFGQAGTVTIRDANLNDYGGVTVLGSGNLLLVGDTGDDQGSEIGLSYLRGDGKVLALDKGASADAGTMVSAAVQTDGRVVIVGTEGSIERHNPDGSLDASFGNGGASEFDLSNITGVTIQDDGKIIVAGSYSAASAVERLNVDGSVDVTFGVNGVSLIPGGSAGTLLAAADGDILASDVIGNGDVNGFGVTRFSGSVGVTAPTASLNAPDLTESGQLQAVITMTYRSASGIDVSTLGDENLGVTDDNGNTLTVSLAGSVQNSDGSVTATYDLAQYSGRNFNYRSNGTYTVSMNYTAVLDSNAVPVAGGELGSLTINIAPPPPGTLPPTAVVNAPYVTAPATVKETVTVTFTGHNGIDESSLNGINVDGPDATIVSASLVSQTDNADGTVTAVYDVSKNDGTQFTEDDNGKYTLSVDDSDPVLDNDGTPMASNLLGSFRVLVAPPPPGAVSPTVGGLLISDGSDAFSRTIAVTYSGSSAIAQQTLDDYDLTVTGSDGAMHVASFQSAMLNGDGSVTAIYTVNLAGYSFISTIRPIVGVSGFGNAKDMKRVTDGGQEQTFTVSINAGQVSDVQGSTVAAGDVGTFQATVPNEPRAFPIYDSVLAARGTHVSHHRRHHHHRFGHASSRHRHHSSRSSKHGARTAAGNIG